MTTRGNHEDTTTSTVVPSASKWPTLHWWVNGGPISRSLISAPNNMNPQAYGNREDTTTSPVSRHFTGKTLSRGVLMGSSSGHISGPALIPISPLCICMPRETMRILPRRHFSLQHYCDGLMGSSSGNTSMPLISALIPISPLCICSRTGPVSAVRAMLASGDSGVAAMACVSDVAVI